jgi:branched-chain amino acid transport system ATP-binding protein
MTNKGPHLRIRDLHAWYGESKVLQGVSLDVPPGETVALLGRNGAGKTTTLRSIIGLVSRREGEISVDGKDLVSIPTHRVAYCGLGYVPEERGIFASLTVAENLLLPPIVAAGGLGVSEIYRLFPNLSERRASLGTKLSGGEQQMLAIARVLRTGARMLLLDEPTEGLAPVIVQRIRDVLLELKALGMTILLVEQNFHFAKKVADSFLLMSDGRIIESFSKSEIESEREHVHALLGV